MKPEDDKLAAQAALYEEVLDSPVTVNVIDFLCRTRMLLRIAGDKVDTVKPVMHTYAGRQAALTEYEQLNDTERHELHATVAQHWSLNVNLAVRKLWHASEILGFKADTLDPQDVAMTAATYFSRAPEDVIYELTTTVE